MWSSRQWCKPAKMRPWPMRLSPTNDLNCFWTRKSAFFVVQAERERSTPSSRLSENGRSWAGSRLSRACREDADEVPTCTEPSCGISVILGCDGRIGMSGRRRGRSARCRGLKKLQRERRLSGVSAKTPLYIYSVWPRRNPDPDLPRFITMHVATAIRKSCVDSVHISGEAEAETRCIEALWGTESRPTSRGLAYQSSRHPSPSPAREVWHWRPPA
jgi:hypothetical protein